MKKLFLIFAAALFLFGCQSNASLVRQEISSTKTTIENLLLPPETAKKEPIRLLFAGDLMFDRSIRQIMEKKGPAFILEPLHDKLHGSDAVIANLEGPITSFDSTSVESEVGSSKNYIFTFDPQVAQLLSDENIQIVNLGNNHIGNYGVPGIEQTREYLESAHVTYFGNTGRGAVHRFIVRQYAGKRIAFVNYNQFVSGSLPAALEDIEAAKKEADFVVVYTHWGTEYLSQAEHSIQDKAHSFVDAGADLVIGSHPHVIQQSEVYNGKTIYYSLGNFVFDQYLQPETQKGMLVEITINPETRAYTAEEFPIKLQLNGQSVPLE